MRLSNRQFATRIEGELSGARARVTGHTGDGSKMDAPSHSVLERFRLTPEQRHRSIFLVAFANRENPMSQILVLYYSTYGHIEMMANAIAESARSVAGATVALKRVPETIP